MTASRFEANRYDEITKVGDSKKLVPCVRYGYPKNSDNPRQSPTLQKIYEQIPDGATTVSPVYLLSQEEYSRQTNLENPYAVTGASCIATALQNSCEHDSRVYYPIHVESDAHEDGVSFEKMIEWLTQFVEEELDVSQEKCRFYYSGNRSIHIHVPKAVIGERDRKRLKKIADQFCDETDAELDTGIYDPKSQFRIPGVEHRNGTGFRKVEIEPHWNHDRIINAATQDQFPIWSYSDVLKRVFERISNQPIVDHTIGRAIFANESCILSLESHDSDVGKPIIEQESEPLPRFLEQWEPYNRKEFSPYANSSGKGRSIAVVRVLGGAFARKDTRKGATLIPAFHYAAVGCEGKYTKFFDRAPLQLSKQDYRKWDYRKDDHVVIIGGQSRNSRIFSVYQSTAEIIGIHLRSNDGVKENVFRFLDLVGYEIGENGQTSIPNQENLYGNKELDEILPANEPTTDAARLQQQAEQNGIHSLSHQDQLIVANRLLSKGGWRPTWEWFENQYESDFNPDMTWMQLKGIAESYDDLSHIDVPPFP